MNLLRRGALFLSILLILPLASVADEGEGFEPTRNITPGDYFDYSVDYSGLIDQVVGNTGVFSDVQITSASEMKYDFPSSPCVHLEGSCYLETKRYSISLALLVNGTNDSDYMTMSSFSVVEHGVGQQWIEETFAMEFFSAVPDTPGSFSYYESIMVTTTNITILETGPIRVSVGDQWSTYDEWEQNSSGKDRETEDEEGNSGEWTEYFSESSWSLTTNYHAEKTQALTVNGMTFNCIKIRWNDYNSGDWGINYVTESGMIVKFVSFSEDGTKVMEGKLTKYQYAIDPNQHSTSGAMDGIGIFLALVVSSLAVLILAVIFRRGKAYLTGKNY